METCNFGRSDSVKIARRNDTRLALTQSDNHALLFQYELQEATKKTANPPDGDLLIINISVSFLCLAWHDHRDLEGCPLQCYFASQT